MLILLSPAKSLDFESRISSRQITSHFFREETAFLAAALRKISVSELEKLMGISPKLAQLNHQRFQNFSAEFNQANSRQALLAFDGDVYRPIDARNFKDSELSFAQDHLRILSGLYGLLRPLDLIQPYRLEMGTSFTDPKIFKKIGIKNLYSFWQERISAKLEEECKNLGVKVILNLASEEYFLVVRRDKISVPILDIEFKENIGGKLKIIGIRAKKARGMMTNFVIKNKLSQPSQLKDFKDDGYSFSAELSVAGKMVFVRR
jgi:uncharacterized protein